MSRITVTYSEEQGGDGLAYTRIREFDSRPTLQELDDFFEEITVTIDPDSFDKSCDSECDDLNGNQETEFVLQIADMVEDVITDTMIDTMESYMDSVLDEVDAIKDEEIQALAFKEGYKGQIGQTVFVDVFTTGFRAGLAEMEDIMLRKFDEAVDALEGDEGCEECPCGCGSTFL